MKKIFRLGCVGVGNMCGALLDGVFGSGVEAPENVILYDLCSEKLERFVNIGCTAASSEAEVVESCSALLLAIKPQGMKELLERISPFIDEQKLIISIAAGISIDFITAAIGKKVPVVRVLPNTPMVYSAGVTAITSAPPADSSHLDYVKMLFSSCSKVYSVPEEDFNKVICLFSSSPAYFFRFAKAMVDGAAAQGIDRELATEMVIGAILGSSVFMDKSDMDFDSLIKMVASPGGTTEASLKSFTNDSFDEIIARAMQACTDRADELGGKK